MSDYAQVTGASKLAAEDTMRRVLPVFGFNVLALTTSLTKDASDERVWSSRVSALKEQPNGKPVAVLVEATVWMAKSQTRWAATKINFYQTYNDQTTSDRHVLDLTKGLAGGPTPLMEELSAIEAGALEAVIVAALQNGIGLGFLGWLALPETLVRAFILGSSDHHVAFGTQHDDGDICVFVDSVNLKPNLVFFHLTGTTIEQGRSFVPFSGRWKPRANFDLIDGRWKPKRRISR